MSSSQFILAYLPRKSRIYAIFVTWRAGRGEPVDGKETAELAIRLENFLQ